MVRNGGHYSQYHSLKCNQREIQMTDIEILMSVFLYQEITYLKNTNTKTAYLSIDDFCGPYGIRTRDLLRDKQMC